MQQQQQRGTQHCSFGTSCFAMPRGPADRRVTLRRPAAKPSRSGGNKARDAKRAAAAAAKKAAAAAAAAAATAAAPRDLRAQYSDASTAAYPP